MKSSGEGATNVPMVEGEKVTAVEVDIKSRTRQGSKNGCGFARIKYNLEILT